MPTKDKNNGSKYLYDLKISKSPVHKQEWK